MENLSKKTTTWLVGIITAFLVACNVTHESSNCELNCTSSVKIEFVSFVEQDGYRAPLIVDVIALDRQGKRIPIKSMESSSGSVQFDSLNQEMEEWYPDFKDRSPWLKLNLSAPRKIAAVEYKQDMKGDCLRDCSPPKKDSSTLRGTPSTVRVEAFVIDTYKVPNDPVVRIDLNTDSSSIK